MLVVVLAAITTPFVSPVLQARDIDAYVLLDLRKLVVNKVRRKNVFVPVFCLQQKLLFIFWNQPVKSMLRDCSKCLRCPQLHFNYDHHSLNFSVLLVLILFFRC